MIARVDFIYGLGSRYSYLASTQIGRIVRETGVRFCWKPISSRVLLARREDNPFLEGAGGQYDWDYRRRDAEAWARYYGVPFNDPVGRLRYDSSLPALAAMAAGRQKRVEATSHRLLVIQCSGSKAAFPGRRSEGPRIRDQVPASIGRRLGRARDANRLCARIDEQTLVPAWERYSGHFLPGWRRCARRGRQAAPAPPDSERWPREGVRSGGNRRLQTAHRLAAGERLRNGSPAWFADEISVGGPYEAEERLEQPFAVRTASAHGHWINALQEVSGVSDLLVLSF